MRVERLDVDSEVFGRDVLAVHDFDAGANFDAFEREYMAVYAPTYVSCKLAIESIADAHALERNGFHFVECQIRSTIKLRKPYDTSRFEYDFGLVTDEEQLEQVLAIAGSTFVHDRFSIDPAIDPSASGRRYQAYVRKSFSAPDEAVYQLVERTSGRTVAFKTHALRAEGEVLFLLGGVASEYKSLGLGVISEYFEFNELMRNGVTKGTTHISASNYPIFNLEIGKLGFRVTATFAIFRKIYA